MAGVPSNQPCLTVLGGPMSGTQFLIEDAVDNILIGSDSSCKFCLPLPGVSPIHARIWLDAAGATVYDTHSPRGLYVNDDRVNGEASLKNGDILWLGTPGEEDVVMIQCRLPRPAPPAEAPHSPLAEPEPTLVMASEPVGAPPGESEFYVEVLPEPPPVDVTTVLAGPPDEIAAPQPPSYEEPPRLTPIPLAPGPALETEFEDETFVEATPPPARAEAPGEEPETIAVAPAAPREPTPAPSPPPRAARVEAPVARPASAAPRPAVSPRPTPAAPRPAPAPEPRQAPSAPTSPMRGLAIAAGILAILTVGGFLAWRWLRPARTAVAIPTPAPPPSTAPRVTLPATTPDTMPPVVETPAPQAPVEEVVTTVKFPSPKAPSPSPAVSKPSPSPKAPATPAPLATPAGPSPEEQRAQQAAAIAGLLGQAEAAAARPEDALRLYDEVLKLDPMNARATAGKAAAQAAAAASRRRFAAGRTSIQSAKAKADLSGFDSADVQVADAPGRIDFEATPSAVKPGDSFAVKVFFVNEAKKAIKVRSLSVSTATNGARTGGAVSPRVREIAPGQRAQIDEVAGVWKDGTSSWSVDVVLVSERNDTYRNQVSWR